MYVFKYQHPIDNYIYLIWYFSVLIIWLSNKGVKRSNEKNGCVDS